LGLIALVLPNRYDVFMHSTPAPELFRRARRSFSHGCIRVSDPIALAEQVLSATPGNWSRAKIMEATASNTSVKVALAQPLQVLILYGTAIATEDGAVHFFEDIYGHDSRLSELLGGGGKGRSLGPSEGRQFSYY
jgi:murein L,D-transpeptidase YcbB/YkuD